MLSRRAKKEILKFLSFPETKLPYGKHGMRIFLSS